MSKRDITRDIRELQTVTPSARLDSRIQHARDAAIHAQTPAKPVRLGWAAIFGIGMGVAGFGIGFLVAINFIDRPVQPAVPDVQVRLVLSDQVGPNPFDFSQQADPPFGRFFDRADNTQGIKQ